MVPVASVKRGGNRSVKFYSAGIDANNELPKGPVPGPQGRVFHLDAAT